VWWHGYLLAERTVRRAGFKPESFLPVYWACKLLAAVGVPVLLFWAGLSLRAFSVIATAVGASFAVELWLWLRMRRRQRRISQALSYFVDMTTAFLRAGMSLDAAIDRAIEYGLPPRNPLQQEMLIVRSEFLAGRSREEVLSALWARTGVGDLQSVAITFRIGFDIGTPIVAALERQAEILRERMRERRLKRINGKMALAMVLLVIFNFPVLLLIIFYPPLLEFANLLFLWS